MGEKIIRKAYPRLGLMGNPTDAIGGSALAVTIEDFWAESTLETSDKIRIIEPDIEQPVWKDLKELEHTIHSMGYYGGRRLMLALLHRIITYCKSNNSTLNAPNFTLTWKTTIPRRVGLGGSTALLTSALRALMIHYQLQIPLSDQVNILLQTETDNLKIPAGPMDRVAEVFEGLTHYEKAADATLKIEHLDPSSLPPLFIAIDESSSEGTEVFHSNLRERFLSNDPIVMNGLQKQILLTKQAGQLLKSRKGRELGPLLDENYDIRQSISQLNPRHSIMVEQARKAGAYAKFAGSGGTIVGMPKDKPMNEVIQDLQRLGYRVLQPKIKVQNNAS